MSEIHKQAMLQSLAIANYEAWAPHVAEAIRPAMAMWDTAEAAQCIRVLGRRINMLLTSGALICKI